MNTHLIHKLRRIRGGAALVLALGLSAAGAADYATPAEIMRARLVEAGLESSFDPASALELVEEAQGAYGELSGPFAEVAPAQAEAVAEALQKAKGAAAAGDPEALATARGEAWTALLGGAWRATQAAIEAGNSTAARDWFAVREFRTASSLTRMNVGGAVALEQWASGQMQAAQALENVQADVLDGYGARLNEAMTELEGAREAEYRTIEAEQVALIRGYFDILAPQYAEQRGEAALGELRAELAALPASLGTVQGALETFRAAPLSEREVRARTSQAIRFAGLVPVEYLRGVKGEAGSVTVTQEVEVTEARTFMTGALAALGDLMPVLGAQQPELLPRGREWLAELSAINDRLQPAAMQADPIPPAELESRVLGVVGSMKGALPEDWQKQTVGADLDIIRTQLDAAVQAAAAGDWAAAETARLDAYSLLESGTEARIAVFNPELKVRLEDLLWHGRGPDGFAPLIEQEALQSEFAATRAALEEALAETGRILGTEVAPAAVATNAGIIVFREGLEAVLILAALMGSLRKGSLVRLRRPMWLGAAAAAIATAATWFVMQRTLSLLGQYGEKLEAVVSLIAIAVLLLIMNWFFHQVYWTDRMAAFQKTKHALTHGTQAEQDRAQRAQWWGLAILGFTSIYREGFETVLFLQSLVLQSGAASVLGGTAVGLAIVLGIGVLVFRWQAKLPMKKLLIWTGLLICAVLGVMVGNTVHTMQLVGWLPVHPLPTKLPAWMGLWLGIHGTWEGLLLQVGSVLAVVGSFFAAEGIKKKELEAKRVRAKAAAAGVDTTCTNRTVPPPAL